MVINVGGLAGLTTVVMVMMLGRTRVLFAMSRDGLVTRKLARTNHKGVPVRITLIVGGVVAVLGAVFPMGVLEEMVNIGTLFAFVLVCVGVMVLGRPVPTYRVDSGSRFMPWAPILAVIACGRLMLNLWRRGSGSRGGWLGVGAYFAYGRRKSVLGQRLAAEAAEQAAAQGEIRESSMSDRERTYALDQDLPGFFELTRVRGSVGRKRRASSRGGCRRSARPRRDERRPPLPPTRGAWVP